MTMKNHPYRTATTRKQPSRPSRWLSEHGFLDDDEDTVLDFGCGKGMDADYFGYARYDPHFFPDEPKNKYLTILCMYVLNVLEPSEVEGVLNHILSLLLPSGKAYLAVRRDIKKEGFTKRGTYQRNVVLDLPVVVENSSFCIYEMPASFNGRIRSWYE